MDLVDNEACIPCMYTVMHVIVSDKFPRRSNKAY